MRSLRDDLDLRRKVILIIIHKYMIYKNDNLRFNSLQLIKYKYRFVFQ